MRLLLPVLALFAFASPAQAQLYFEPPPMSQVRVNGMEPGMIEPLPGTPPADVLAAGLTWNFRGGMNVAALTCASYPLLRTSEGYRALLYRHADELLSAHDRLEGWFISQAPNKRSGQRDFDRWNTRVYNGWATLKAKRRFCHVANRVAVEIIYPPHERASTLAQRSMAAFRESLIPANDQFFRWRPPDLDVPTLCEAKKKRLVRCP